MPDLPAYVSITFILTTFVTIGFLLHSVRTVGVTTAASRIVIFLLPLAIFFHGGLAAAGFYQDTSGFPPRVMIFGVFPALVVIATLLVFFRGSFIHRLPLRNLTLIHVVRVPVEVVLYWLFTAGLIPQTMTFFGQNFDIAAGILAPIVTWLAFRNGRERRGLLLAYHVLGLVLLANIVVTAVLSLPTPIQQFGFDQPNRGVLLFPYIWLPAIVVPIVLFSHLAALVQLWRPSREVLK